MSGVIEFSMYLILYYQNKYSNYFSKIGYFDPNIYKSVANYRKQNAYYMRGGNDNKIIHYLIIPN